MAFTQKLISVSFSNGTEISHLRMSCHAVAAGRESMGQLDLLIYGMTLSHMNQLSTLGWVGGSPRGDTVSVSAGDENGLTLIYKGTIWGAWSDFQGGPNLPFHVVAQAGATESATQIKPTSINNRSADVAQMMSKLAGQMNLQFENNGVNAKIAYPYLPGSARTQAMALANHANINWAIDRGTLAIWPMNGSRGGTMPFISPQTGMVGYPSWSSIGIKVRTLFNPDIKIGGKVRVQSSITPANNVWSISKVEHNLQALTPDGEWFTTFEASDPTKAVPGQPPLAQ